MRGYVYTTENHLSRWFFLVLNPDFDYNQPIIMTTKTKKEVLAEKRAAALRENLRRRKDAVPKAEAPQTEKK